MLPVTVANVSAAPTSSRSVRRPKRTTTDATKSRARREHECQTTGTPRDGGSPTIAASRETAMQAITMSPCGNSRTAARTASTSVAAAR